MTHHSLLVFYNNEIGTWEYQVHFIDKTVLVGYGQYHEDTLASARREAYRLDCELKEKQNAHTEL